MTLAVYVHWPFCISKCPYCDFNSHVGDTTNQELWRRSYRREIEYYAQLLGNRTITSVFFGGGTPSLMDVSTVESILNDIARLWRLDDSVEITLEANPSSVEQEKFSGFRTAGVNRLSLGVQSFDEQALAFLGRAHSADDAKRAISIAAQTFSRFSFDLIYARQNQTLSQWEKELSQALSLAGDHLSLYQLTIEPNTHFHTRTRRGEILTAADDPSVDMFELTQSTLNKAGMPAYEISNHARQGQESRHNLTYWHYEDYVGIGPGAHGRYQVEQTRYGNENHRAPEAWIRQTETQGHGTKENYALDSRDAMREAILMGLRLHSGLNLEKWAKKFPQSLKSFLSPDPLEKLIGDGFLEQDAIALRATAAGLQRLNAVLAYLDL